MHAFYPFAVIELKIFKKYEFVMLNFGQIDLESKALFTVEIVWNENDMQSSIWIQKQPNSLCRQLESKEAA